MRFRANIQNITTFTKFTASLASLGSVAWVRLDEHEVRFTIIPEQGTQVWAVLSIDTILDAYTIQSAAQNVINLEVPLRPLHAALRTALSATSASIRLTKKDNIPLLCLTIHNTSLASSLARPGEPDARPEDSTASFGGGIFEFGASRDRETIITQDIPVRVLSQANVAGLHEPRCREPDVHILLPPLTQLKSISDRFTRLALATKTGSTTSGFASSAAAPKLEMAANMHGCLRVGLRIDAMNISSVWTGLSNPELDPSVVEGGEEGIRNHPSTKMKALGDSTGRGGEGWASVRIDGRDWGRVLSVGRLGGRVIACKSNYAPSDLAGRQSLAIARG